LATAYLAAAVPYAEGSPMYGSSLQGGKRPGLETHCQGPQLEDTTGLAVDVGEAHPARHPLADTAPGSACGQHDDGTLGVGILNCGLLGGGGQATPRLQAGPDLKRQTHQVAVCRRATTHGMHAVRKEIEDSMQEMGAVGKGGEQPTPSSESLTWNTPAACLWAGRRKRKPG
jgi:hypothetical protein